MRLKTLLKAAISALLLWMLLRVVDLHALKATVLNISPGMIALVTLGYLVGQLLSSIKWWIIVRSSGVDTSLVAAFKAYFIGMFVNVLGIGTLGGDMTRAMLIATGPGSKAVGLASVVADRAHGLAVLATIGTAATALFGRHALEPTFVVMLVGLGLTILTGWFLGPRVLLAIVPRGAPIRTKAEMATRAFPRSPGIITLITAISFLFHLVQIGLHALMAAAVGVQVPWSYLFVAVPFANIVSTLPISWQGLGVRENAYRFFFVPAVLTGEQAIAFGAMWFFAMTVSGCIGGLVSLLTRNTEIFSEDPPQIGQVGPLLPHGAETTGVDTKAVAG
jgi:hypothetical protein